MAKLVIFGAGGLGVELLTNARADPREIIFASDQPEPPVLGVPVINSSQITEDDEVVIAIADPVIRAQIAERPYRFGQLIAPTAVIGVGVDLGPGAIVYDFAGISARIKIGRHLLLNSYSHIGHDSEIGDCVTFGPKVACNGNVRIGDGAQIGCSAALRQGTPEKPLLIGRGAIVGMGSIVTRDVPEGITVVGNPARLIERKLQAVA